MSSMDYNWQEVMGCSLMWPAIENLAVRIYLIHSILVVMIIQLTPING